MEDMSGCDGGFINDGKEAYYPTSFLNAGSPQCTCERGPVWEGSMEGEPTANYASERETNKQSSNPLTPRKCGSPYNKPARPQMDNV